MTVPLRGGRSGTDGTGLTNESGGSVGDLTAPFLLSNLMMKPFRGRLLDDLLGGGRYRGT
jgi:hypothetical protein